MNGLWGCSLLFAVSAALLLSGDQTNGPICAHDFISVKSEM